MNDGKPGGKPRCYCAAHGCQLLGVSSTSTTGADDWWCFLHFGKDAVRTQAITVEANRREWLVRVITDVRKGYWSDEWPAIYRVAQHDIAMGQRNDLQYGSAGHENESVWAWIGRLESALASMCEASFSKPPVQTQIATDDSWNKVGFQVPQAA